MDWKSALPIIDKFITWATGKKLAMLALAILVIISLGTTYQRRADVGAFVAKKFGDTQPDTGIPELSINLTPEIITRIKETVDRNPDINYLGVVSANIRINQRELIYFYSNDPIVTSDFQASSWHIGSSRAIFTSSEKSNEQMVAVINGEFGCFKYADTINYTAAPTLVNKIPYICRVSLPPYYGEFSGYLVFGVRVQPDEGKANEVRIEAVRLATEIYFKAIAKGRRGPG